MKSTGVIIISAGLLHCVLSRIMVASSPPVRMPGFIYQVFGFGYLRELQLHEEAGFQPLEVITHATHNSAKVLGMGESLGQVRIGYVADLVIVNGNPLEDLRVLMPRNIPTLTGDESTGGIEWTIKDGIPYHAPTMLTAVREMVTQSRAENPINYLVPASR